MPKPDYFSAEMADALKGGACDYLTKPFGLRELQMVFAGASARLQQRIAERELSLKIQSNGFGKIIGRAPEMEKVYRILARAAQTNHPVLILGESGTGKELVAHAIHYSGPFHVLFTKARMAEAVTTS